VIGDYASVGAPMRRRRRWGWIFIGLLMAFGGALAAALGIAAAVNARDAIEDQAVARAPLGQPTSFKAVVGERYTVYVIAGRAESIAPRVECETGGGARFSGSKQGTTVTLGSATSVGRFDATERTVDIVCGGPTTAPYVVSPGGTGIVRGILEIIIGAFVALGGIALIIWGLIGRRVPA
jgi:hypothetical protein